MAKIRKGSRSFRPAALQQWTRRDDIVARRSRSNALIGCLSVIACVWLFALTPPVDSDVVGGVLILECATAVPLVMAVRDRRRVRNQLRQMESAAAARGDAFALEARQASERAWRLGQLIEQLDGRAHAEARRQSQRALESAVSAHERLLERRQHLVSMREVVSDRARTHIDQSLRTCDAQLRSLTDAIDDIATAVAQLLSDSSAGSVQEVLAGIESADLRLTSLAAAWRELDALDPPTATAP